MENREANSLVLQRPQQEVENISRLMWLPVLMLI